MMFKNMAWTILLAVLTALTLLSIPRHGRLRLFTFGIVWGGGLYLILNIIGVPLLGLWRFTAGGIQVAGIPLLLVASAVPGAMLLARMIGAAGSPRVQVGIVAMAAVAITLIDAFNLSRGYAVHSRWSILSTFGLAGLACSGLAFYLDNPNIALLEEEE